MSKGFAVYPLMHQPKENVIDEKLIRECIYLAPPECADEERLRVVGKKEENVLKEKMRKEMAEMDLVDINTLLFSYQRIGKIQNLFGLGNLTKLCLDNNKIVQIENLEHLVTLQWLDLSFNQISEIKGLDTLVNLEHLSLFSNQISSLEGLSPLKNLDTLSVGNNKVENLEETVHQLHRLRKLRVLTLKGCKVETQPHYRARILAFISTLRFFDGRSIKPEEIATAKEDQRENLVPIDEEDERIKAEEKRLADQEAELADYESYNCPNETKLYDLLMKLQPDGRNMYDVLHSDMIYSALKESLDRYQSEFLEKAKELADAMKAIRGKRDNDDNSYKKAKRIFKTKNAASCRRLIDQFEDELKLLVPEGVIVEKEGIQREERDELKIKLDRLRFALMEHEADQYEAMESLYNGTTSKWKGDAVDVLLQTSFEVFYRMESDFHHSIRQIFDSAFDMRQKNDRPESLYFMGRQDENITALLENKEEYQKVLSDWAEMRRKKLEEMELFHLKNEEHLLTERNAQLFQEEQQRHRDRIMEIEEYIRNVLNRIDSL